MTKTCGKCGHAALDDQAQFCNRCGAAVPEKKKPAFPVCPACDLVVSDELAQFCNRCGTKILPLPVVCNSCGSPAIDNQSRFCTRCGTTFGPKVVSRTTNCPSCGAPDPQGQSIYCNRCGAPFNRQGVQAAPPSGLAPVILTQRKPAGPLPPVTIPDADWQPWNDIPPAPEMSGTPGPAIPEQSTHQDQQVAIPQRRYAHLPLVADDMRKDEPAPSQKKKTVSQKKGVIGFLKK
jgi:hypothetical protein